MTEHEQKPQQGLNPSIGPALSKTIHIGIPIASVLLVLAFAIVSFQPPYKGTLPVESTLVFIPVYLTIVVILVFGSMYLFKRLVDGEPPSSSTHA